jgi:lactate permease
VVARRRGIVERDGVTWRAVATAGAPYLAIVGLIVLTRMIQPLRDALSGIAIEWTLPGGFGGSFQPLFHPGSMLLLGLLVGAAVQRQRPAAVTSSMAAAARRLVPVAIALVVMLSLSRVMLHAGMIDALARAAANGTGGAWPLVAPAVGVLGSFVTGSATTSNILFTNLQATTAADLGLPVVLIVAAQGVGAAIGNIISPLNVIAGAATVGLAGREGAIMARTLPACLACAVVAGVVVLTLTRAGGP